MSRLLGGQPTARDMIEKRPNYLAEGIGLEKQGDLDAALTSYRLALRYAPEDARVLLNMAIALTKANRVEEAIRSYRKALEVEPRLDGAHYGLAYLLLKRGDTIGAEQHLVQFLGIVGATDGESKWATHARGTLALLRGETLAAVGDEEVPSDAPVREATVHPMPLADAPAPVDTPLRATGTHGRPAGRDLTAGA
ncbi:MAG: tetratricopeptide repeat protein [Gemmatimonadaceae bacterium]|nr:tetratricopeptide repeat protein [Gemmatimonadaceae bacterium]